VGVLLTFLLSFLGFAPPLLLGGIRNFTVEVWIYSLVRGVYVSPALGSAPAFWTILFLAFPSVLYLLLARRARLLGGTPRPVAHLRAWDRRSVRTYPFLLATLLLLGFLFLMVGSILLTAFRVRGGSLGFENFTSLFAPQVSASLGVDTATALVNTLFFAAMSTTLVLFVVLGAGFARRAHPHAGFLVDVLVFLPLLVSPVILAFALLDFWGGSLGQPATLWVLIVLSQAALALPFVLQSMTLALRSLPPSGRDAAETLGASPWRAFLHVDVPLARGALVAGALFAFALSLGEFAATNFLYVPAYATLVVELFVLQSPAVRMVGAAAALAAVLLLLSFASFAAIVAGGRRVRL
jgi:thiamine transport system permease protein